MRVPLILIGSLLVLAGLSGSAQTPVTAPRQQFGFAVGDDYQLANYTQIADYWRKLDAESDRMVVTAVPGVTDDGH